MRGSKARLIRRLIYGTENSPRARSYRQERLSTGKLGSPNETVFADDRRRMYQDAKRAA